MARAVHVHEQVNVNVHDNVYVNVDVLVNVIGFRSFGWGLAAPCSSVEPVAKKDRLFKALTEAKVHAKLAVLVARRDDRKVAIDVVFKDDDLFFIGGEIPRERNRKILRQPLADRDAS